MKLRSIFNILVLLLFCSASYAVAAPTQHISGVNYDPAHSEEFIEGQQLNNINLMRDSIDKDLAYIHDVLGFNTIKTFYSFYSGINGKNKIDITKEAQKYHLKVALGVFEFKPSNGCNNETTCKAWTKQQVDEVTHEVNQDHNVTSVIIGNEDANDSSIADRIVADAKTIKAATKNKVPVGTAQTQSTVTQLIKDYPSKAKVMVNTLDFIGVNIYPFWGGASWSSSTQTNFLKTFHQLQNTLKSKANKPLVETEEGWPSAGNSRATMPAMLGYYHWWQSRINTDNFDSYYFAAFDKLPEGSPDNYFGIATIDRNQKPGGLINDYLVTFSAPNLKDSQIINACNAANQCWPLYGSVSVSSVSPDKSVIKAINPQVVDHMLMVTNDHNHYPASCVISHDQMIKLAEKKRVTIIWSKDGKGDKPCIIN